MSAIITPTFRRNAAEDFKTGIDNVNNNYYIGIGRLIPWPNNADGTGEEATTFSEPLPQVTLAEEKDVRDELMTLVKVEENSAMIPRNPWTADRRYKRYDPTDPLTFELEGNLYPCITVSDDKIYLCIENNSDSNGVIDVSTLEPHIDNITFQSASQKVGSDRGDGYVWAYIGALDTTSKLDNSEFISVSADVLTDPSSESPAGAGADLATAALNATGGLVYGFKVIETPAAVDLNTIDLVLEGIDANNEKIADVNIVDSSGSPTSATIDSRFTILGPGSSQGIDKLSYTNNSFTGAPAGYKKANVIAYTVDSAGTRTKIDDIKIIPLLAPLEGFGYDIKTHTPAHYIGVYARFAESVDSEALTVAAYRQISILKNPQRRTDDSPDDINNPDVALVYADEEAIDCLNYIELASNETNLQGFDPGTVISQASSGAKAQVVHVDLGAKKIYYQQQDQFLSNFLPFDDPADSPSSVGDIVTEGSNPVTLNGSDVIRSYTSEYIHDTGEVLFVDNRKRINRNSDQIEDLRIVIQF